MPYRRILYVRSRLGLMDWLIVLLALAIVVAVVIAVTVVTLSLFLLLLPLVAITAAFSYLYWRIRRPARGAVTIIDGQYRVLDDPSGPEPKSNDHSARR